MRALWKVVALLVASNLFMTHAWYGHLRDLKDRPVLVAVLASWGIAFFEYLLQVPANRLGDQHGLGLQQLKITQEVVALAVFVPYSILYMKRAVTLDYLYAGLCILGAAYFIFRGGVQSGPA